MKSTPDILFEYLLRFIYFILLLYLLYTLTWRVGFWTCVTLFSDGGLTHLQLHLIPQVYKCTRTNFYLIKSIP